MPILDVKTVVSLLIKLVNQEQNWPHHTDHHTSTSCLILALFSLTMISRLNLWSIELVIVQSRCSSACLVWILNSLRACRPITVSLQNEKQIIITIIQYMQSNHFAIYRQSTMVASKQIGRWSYGICTCPLRLVGRATAHAPVLWDKPHCSNRYIIWPS